MLGDEAGLDRSLWDRPVSAAERSVHLLAEAIRRDRVEALRAAIDRHYPGH